MCSNRRRPMRLDHLLVRHLRVVKETVRRRHLPGSAAGRRNARRRPLPQIRKDLGQPPIQPPIREVRPCHFFLRPSRCYNLTPLTHSSSPPAFPRAPSCPKQPTSPRSIPRCVVQRGQRPGFPKGHRAGSPEGAGFGCVRLDLFRPFRATGPRGVDLPRALPGLPYFGLSGRVSSRPASSGDVDLLRKHNAHRLEHRRPRVPRKADDLFTELVKKWGQAPFVTADSQDLLAVRRSQSPFLHKLTDGAAWGPAP